MNIFNFFKGKFKNEVKTDNKSYSINNFFRDYLSNLDKEPTLLNCLKYRAESLGKMPIKLIQIDDTGQTELKDNNLYKVFLRPNKNEDCISFWAEVERERLSKGTSYVYIQRDSKGKVISLKRLKKEFMTLPVVDDPYLLNDTLVYTYNSVAGPVKMTNEDLLIFKNTTLKPNQIEGESVLTLLRIILESNANGNTAIANINKNGIQSTVKIAVTDQINEDSALDIIENAIGQARGATSTGVVFQENGVTIEPFQVKLNEADYLNIYKNNQCIILSYFGLSASMLNIEQSTGTYQNSESQMLQYLVNTLLYVMEHYVAELNYKLLTPQEIAAGITFSFDTTGILKVDYETLVNTQVSLVGSAINTVDEARKKLGFNNLPNNTGEVSIVNGAYVSLDNLGIAYLKDSANNVAKGGEKSNG